MLTAAQILELKAKRSKLLADRLKIAKEAETAKRAMTAEEKEKFASLLKEANDYGEQIGSNEALEEAQRAVDSDNTPRNQPANRVDTAQEVVDEFGERALSKYSVHRAIRCAVDKRPLDGLEGEIHQELAKRRTDKPAQGILIPLRVLAEGARRMTRAQRALDTTSGSGGLQNVVSSEVIDLLRPRVIVAALGATMLGGLVGTFSIPKQTAGAGFYWYTEGNAPTDSNQTLGHVQFTPKFGGARTDITRAFMQQTSIDAEMFTRNDLFKQLAVGLDIAAINGPGSGGAPKGIMNETNIPTINTTGTPTWANIVAMETIVAEANVMLNTPAYLGTPGVKGLLKTTPKIGNTFPTYIWDGNELNGYNAQASNVVPSNLGVGSNKHGLIFGNWEDMVIGMWGAADLLVDPYSLSSSGGVRLVLLQDIDIQFRQFRSFVKIKDLDTTGVDSYS